MILRLNDAGARNHEAVKQDFESAGALGMTITFPTRETIKITSPLPGAEEAVQMFCSSSSVQRWLE